MISFNDKIDPLVTAQQRPVKEHWKTQGQVYGEDTVPLLRIVDPRFYHPKTVTEITKKYGTSLKEKHESAGAKK